MPQVKQSDPITSNYPPINPSPLQIRRLDIKIQIRRPERFLPPYDYDHLDSSRKIWKRDEKYKRAAISRICGGGGSD